MKYIKTYFPVLIVALFVISCENENELTKGVVSTEIEVMEEGTPLEGEVHLKQSQMEAIGLKTAKFAKIKTSGFFAANGEIDLPPSSVASVNAKAEGFVMELKNLVIGSHVKKGQVLAVLEHPNYLQKQQDYLELQSKLTWLQQEYDRQKSLNNSAAGVLKSFQKSKMDLEICQSQKMGIAQYLNYIGIDVASISNQNFQKYIYVRAPLTGYISGIFVNQGKHIKPEMLLMEIVNNHHVHLELNVFEKDIAKVKEDQKVTFTIPSYGNQQFEAKVHEVGRTLNEETKAIMVHCHLIGQHPEFVQGIYAQAKIWNDAETVLSLPETAILKEGQTEYIFENVTNSTEESVFKTRMIRSGKKDGGMVEIIPIDSIREDADFVIEGAYYLNAELNSEEGGGHSH